MNLVHGKIISTTECDALIQTLPAHIQETLAKPRLHPALVIDACDTLSRALEEHQHEQTLVSFGLPKYFAKEYIADAKVMLSREYLTHKLQTELGLHYDQPHQHTPPFYDQTVTQQLLPLGVLFHIAAGNADGLPIFTILEGLLTGNINLLKLPHEEGGITVRMLQELFQIQPLLSEYVYVFDYTSKDLDVMKQFANMADAIVIWGSDEAIQSVRQLANPNTKIIEWGHKISFAYVSGNDISDEALEGIAMNICQTNQLQCSSCQGIFLDTNSMEDVHAFCERFLPILENVCQAYPTSLGIGIDAQTGLRLYNASLEAIFTDTKIYKGRHCSITAYTDATLTTSIFFRNCWVRRLPRTQILPTLRPYKNHLQTVGLLCNPKDIFPLAESFWKTGVVKITDGRHMSKVYNGAAHDGEYPLRRYTKIVALEQIME